MKLEMDEKLKHRLIGLAVIISIAAIFAPAIVKKSSQHFERDITMEIQLPNRPLHPKVAMKNEKEVFKTTRVAHVNLPSVPEKSQLPQLASAKPIRTKKYKRQMPKTTLAAKQKKELNEKRQVKNHLSDKQIHSGKRHISNQPYNIAKSKKVSSQQLKRFYAVQLASFSKINNARSLSKQLEKQGYPVKISTVQYKNSKLYQVHVGQVQHREAARKLKHDLSAAFHLEGLVIKKEVS